MVVTEYCGGSRAEVEGQPVGSSRDGSGEGQWRSGEPMGFCLENQKDGVRFLAWRDFLGRSRLWGKFTWATLSLRHQWDFPVEHGKWRLVAELCSSKG